nr:MAG TPA: hypothetical protein [Caudoviricetes sp.]
MSLVFAKSSISRVTAIVNVTTISVTPTPFRHYYKISTK